MLCNVNDFFLRDVGKGVKILGCPNVEVALKLKALYVERGAQVLSLYTLFDDELRVLPSPCQTMRLLDKKVANAQGQTIFVVGVDAYLTLLSDSDKKAFLKELQDRLDARRQPNLILPIYVTFLLNSPLTNHPKYQEAKSVVLFEGEVDVQRAASITVVREEWIPKDGSKVASDYKVLLQKLGEFQPKGSFFLAVANPKKHANTPFKYQLDPYEFASQTFNFKASFAARTLEELLRQGAKLKTTPETTLMRLFGVEDFTDATFVLKRLLESFNSPLWDGFLWLCRRKASQASYLYLVLSSDVNASNLLRRYVVDGVLKALQTSSSDDLARFAEERKSTLNLLMDANPSIKVFIKESIDAVSDDEKAVLFLNCQTDAEQIEIVRRVARLDYSGELPEVYRERFATLGDYLTSGDCYRHPFLKEYFDKYRRLKLKDEVTPEFVQYAASARSEARLENLKKRDATLGANFTDARTGVLVVDGIGAEYLPALVAAADRYGLSVDFAEVVAAKTPTATKFNVVQCLEGCKIDEIKGVDVAAHNGAKLHESCSHEENVYASLKEFERVFQRVRENLNKYRRVVVTSDHGTSRLAVLAYNRGLSKTIKLNDPPLDWRYTKAKPGEKTPEGMKEQYDPQENESYWVVVGYDRLSKSGGKLNELHGGETIEELCVPLVVYSLKRNVDVCDASPRRTPSEAAEPLVSKTSDASPTTRKQIVEDDAFADL